MTAAASTTAQIRAQAWSCAPENIARYLATSAELRHGLRCWVCQSAGDVADLIFACADAGYGEDAAGFAHLSRYSPAGFNMRLEHFGQALNRLLQESASAVTDELLALGGEIFAHHEESRAPERIARVEMTVRLLNWLATPQTQSGSFAEAAHRYRNEGGFVDRARYCLGGSDSIPTLAQAYVHHAELAMARREAENKQSAELLANWIEADSARASLLCVEDVLCEIVARVGQSSPVLLVVVDGMSMAVFGELIEDILAKGWAMCAPAGELWPRPVMSALPSVTEVSRTSLFCGKVVRGTSKDEIVGFAKNDHLLRVSRQGQPPVLVHKASLSETSGFDLSADVRKEVASEKRKKDYLWTHVLCKRVCSTFYCGATA